MNAGIERRSAKQDFPLEIPEYFNFAYDVIGKRAREADKAAVIAVDRTGNEVAALTYADLDRESNRFANVLRKVGAQAGDFALVMIPRQPAWLHALLGCMKTGVVAMPGTNLLTAKDIEYRVNRAGARLAIVAADHVAKVDAVRQSCPSLEHLIVVGDASPEWVSMPAACAAADDAFDRSALPPTRASDPMLIFFTSGTTSLPKMVAHDHGYGLAHSLTGRYWMDLREEDIHWTLTDTGWAKAAWGMMFPQFLAGCTMLLYDGEGFDADLHLKLIGRHRVTTFCAPPTIYRILAQIDLAGYDVSSLRHCMSAGEPLNPEAMRSWKSGTGCDIHDGYGQTETVCIVSNRPGMEIRPGSMGKAMPAFEIGIVDEGGAVVPEETVGQIAVRITDPFPPGLFRGYLDDDEATARAFRNGWYCTGDTARRDADGYVWFVGRADDIITSAGYRISPFEVESALIEHQAIVESAVVAKPDPVRGEIVKAYVILAAGHEPSEALTRDIQEFVKSQTAPYKYPRDIEYRAELPKTISGKIRRVELREEARSEA
jgi:acetyl-CoA synthetase